MADDILNMSLDDIIKKNAEKSKQAKGKKPKAAGKDQPKGGKPNKLGRVNQGGVGKKPQAGRVRGFGGCCCVLWGIALVLLYPRLDHRRVAR